MRRDPRAKAAAVALARGDGSGVGAAGPRAVASTSIIETLNWLLDAPIAEIIAAGDLHREEAREVKRLARTILGIGRIASRRRDASLVGAA